MQNYMCSNVSYYVIKMAGDSGYATNLRDIDINVFLTFIQGDIKKLINTYGHKNCGLRQEELCEKIKEIIPEKKKIIFAHMNALAQQKWSREWNKQRSKYFSKLYDEEGFINMCFPTKYKNNPSLNQLLSKHIKFCKEKDDHLSALEKNREYNQCINYNSWIDRERKSFTTEYLRNVNKFKVQNVNKYFSTKKHPGGHDPIETYLNSKLNCTKYKPPPISYPQIPVKKAPTISLHPHAPPDVNQKSQGKRGKSMPDGDDGIKINKPDVPILHQTEASSSDSQTFSLTNTNVDGTPNGQHTGLKAKGTGAPIIAQVTTGKPTEATDAIAQSPQQSPESTSLISPKDTHVPKVLDPPPSVNKDQGATSDKTPSKTSATSDTTHSTQNLSSPSGPDLSLPQPQTPAVLSAPSQHQNQGTSQYTKELITPDTVIKSTDKDASLTSPLDPHSPLDPGSVLAPATASNSSASVTLSTTVSTTSASTAGSSSDQDLLLITATSQSTATTPISTTLIITQTTTATLDPSTTTFSAIDTKPIPGITGITSTKDEGGKPKASIITVSDSHDPNFVSTKQQDVTILPPINVPSPDASDNLNMNQHPSQPLGAPPDPPLGSSPGPPSVLSADENTLCNIKDSNNIMYLFTKYSADSDQIMMSPKDSPQHSKDLTQFSSTSSPKGTQPNDKSIITPTKFPPLTSIIPIIIVILATITLLFLLYKYTPFGLFLGRRRKRKKRDLRRKFVIPEESTYESPNIALHEWEDHNLLGQIVENDAYTKLLKINRYKQEMQKRKKKNKKTLIEVHMQVLEEHKKDEWELHKGDFLEICLRGFINEENETYQNFPNSKLTINNINEKTIEDIQKQEILWNNWIENHRNILEQWKKEEWFHILKNKWKKEQQIYKEKNNKLQENILNEKKTPSIVNQKDIWKQWISKQATLIDMFNKEDWFKSIIYAQDKEKDNCRINEYNNISVTCKTELRNEKTNEGRSKNIIQKLMVQIHMLVLEECIKEDIIKHKELCIDNFIEEMHNNNNYDEKRNIPQCHTDDFNVLKYEEIHTSRNK
ncbi:STP1 protein [Plasmodium ovale wallikeri]|uniref:STP1 protein n=1 Tax=Plasmodium ovale wallikeri TaxID=864142 RepID=A0A1A9AKZ4_PLAOA|nr:STP1 protein [Plasmodium ovale wallikeri]